MPTRTRTGLPKLFVALCGAFGLLFVAWASVWFVAATVRQTQETTKRYAGVAQLRISGSAGDITIVAEERDDVTVLQRSTWALSKPERSQSLSNGELRLTGSCGFWGTFGPDACSVDYVVHVPREMPVSGHVSSGNVRVAGLAGPVRLSVSSGDVSADELSGALALTSSSGDVRVTSYRGADVQAVTSSGEVEVRAFSVPRRVKAVSSSGDVTVALPGQVAYRVEAGTSSGDQDVQVDQSRDAPRSVEARTSSGDVRVVRVADAR